MHRLEGKIALITGGTSGIGLATEKQFVNEGACASSECLICGGQSKAAHNPRKVQFSTD